jgi:hypothetical protein
LHICSTPAIYSFVHHLSPEEASAEALLSPLPYDAWIAAIMIRSRLEFLSDDWHTLKMQTGRLYQTANEFILALIKTIPLVIKFNQLE